MRCLCSGRTRANTISAWEVSSSSSWAELVGMAGVGLSAGNGQDPERLARQLVVHVGHLAPVVVGERDVGARPGDGVAPADQLLRASP